METKNKIEQTLDNLMPEKLVKKKKSPLIPILYLIAGIFAFVINSRINYNHNQFVYLLIFLLGGALLIIGIVTLLFRELHYFDAETGKILKKHESYYDSAEENKLVKLLESNNVQEISQLKKSYAHILKLIVMATSDGKWCFAEVLKSDQSIADVFQYSADKAKELLKAISN